MGSGEVGRRGRAEDPRGASHSGSAGWQGWRAGALTSTPPPLALAPARRLSRKMVWESLRGVRVDPTTTLNVNYAFKTVFIGEAARRTTPPRPVCVP